MSRNCASCHTPLQTRTTGRPARYCSATCRQRAHRARTAAPKSITPAAAGDTWQLYTGPAATVLDQLPASTVQTIVTSPPYFNLRAYTAADDPHEIGRAGTVDEYLQALVDVFHRAARVLTPTGTLWLNVADTYAGRADSGAHRYGGRGHADGIIAPRVRTTDLAPRKSLLGIPWRLALALQADGWIIRSDIVWHKPNGAIESVRDRAIRRHERIFMATRTPRYRFDPEALRDPVTGKMLGDVWTLPIRRRGDEHKATFPIEVPHRCIAASTHPGDTVLDVFSGHATTGLAAYNLGRSYIGIDLNPRYTDEAARRLHTASPADLTHRT